GADSGDNGRPVPHRLQYGTHQIRFLRVAGRRALPCRTTEDEPVVAEIHEVGGQLLRTVEIERALIGEGGDHGGEHPPERPARSCGWRGNAWSGHDADGTCSLCRTHRDVPVTIVLPDNGGAAVRRGPVRCGGPGHAVTNSRRCERSVSVVSCLFSILRSS